MNISIPSFRQGKLLLSLSADVEGEASGHLLALATESVKTACMSALDSSAAKLLPKGVKYERDAQSRESVEAAIAKIKSPEKITNLVVSVVGDWSPKAGSVSKAALAESAMKAMREKGVAEDIIAAVLAAQGLTYAAPVAAVAPTPSEPGLEVSEG